MHGLLAPPADIISAAAAVARDWCDEAWRCLDKGFVFKTRWWVLVTESTNIDENRRPGSIVVVAVSVLPDLLPILDLAMLTPLCLPLQLLVVSPPICTGWSKAPDIDGARPRPPPPSPSASPRTRTPRGYYYRALSLPFPWMLILPTRRGGAARALLCAGVCRCPAGLVDTPSGDCSPEPSNADIIGGSVGGAVAALLLAASAWGLHRAHVAADSLWKIAMSEIEFAEPPEARRHRWRWAWLRDSA